MVRQGKPKKQQGNGSRLRQGKERLRQLGEDGSHAGSAMNRGGQVVTDSHSKLQPQWAAKLSKAATRQSISSRGIRSTCTHVQHAATGNVFGSLMCCVNQARLSVA